MISAAKTAILVTATSFAVSSALKGVGNAWRLQKASHASKLQAMGAVSGPGSFNAATHIAKEVGRAMANSGLSRLAGRGVHSVVSEVATAYAGNIQDSVRQAVGRRWAAVSEQARALHGKLNGDKLTEGIVNNCIQQVLDKARQEQVFTSIARTSKPAISVAASGVANGGWATLASAVPDVANLGVSIGRMATLVEDEVSALARTIRDTKDNRATQEAENPITLESLDAFLATKEREYAKALVGIINSLLETSVYSPLVSYTTQFATDKVIAALMPPTEVERWAASNDNVLEVIDRQADASISHYDDLLVKWRGVNAGVNLADMTPEERAEAFETHVEGTGKSLAEVINDYKGCSLELYRDGQNKLYAQRPQFDDYVAAVSDGKPAGPAEFLAAAIRHNQPITIVDTATENVRTYHPDGRVDGSSPTQAIKLECTPGQQGVLDHITPAGLAETPDPLNTGADCFYKALVQSLNSPEGITIAGERLDIANCMGRSEACKLLYHNNSLDGAVKKFAGTSKHSHGPQAWADAYDALAEKAFDDSAIALMSNDTVAHRAARVGYLTAFQLGRGYADVLRLGEGFKSCTLLGLGKDGLRLASLIPGGALGPKQLCKAFGRENYICALVS